MRRMTEIKIERPTAPQAAEAEAPEQEAQQEEQILYASTQSTNYPPTIERPTATSPATVGKGAEEQGAKPEAQVTTAQQENTEPEPVEKSKRKPANWASMSRKAQKHWKNR